jgi:hypothetical protein
MLHRSEDRTTLAWLCLENTGIMHVDTVPSNRGASISGRRRPKASRMRLSERWNFMTLFPERSWLMDHIILAADEYSVAAYALSQGWQWERT